MRKCSMQGGKRNEDFVWICHEPCNPLCSTSNLNHDSSLAFSSVQLWSPFMLKNFSECQLIVKVQGIYFRAFVNGMNQPIKCMPEKNYNQNLTMKGKMRRKIILAHSFWVMGKLLFLQHLHWCSSPQISSARCKYKMIPLFWKITVLDFKLHNAFGNAMQNKCMEIFSRFSCWKCEISFVPEQCFWLLRT